MKVVRVHGGFGNQLFCLAFAHSISVAENEAVGLDISGFSSDRYGRHFVLNDLVSRFGCFEVLPQRFIRSFTADKAIKKLTWTKQSTTPADGQELRRFISKGTKFDGYWQNEAYIIDLPAVIEKVRAFISAKAPPATIYDAVVHYRTYKEEALFSRRRTPGVDYIRAGLRAISERDGLVRELMLISDDPALAAQHIGDCGVPVCNVGRSDIYRDFATLIAARSLILTNSSFSWWGGVCSAASAVTYPIRGTLVHYPQPAARFLCR